MEPATAGHCEENPRKARFHCILKSLCLFKRTIQLKFLNADGAHGIHKQLDLSGEPLIPQLREKLQLRDPIPLLIYQDLTIQGRDYEAAYSDYWNSTVNQDGKLCALLLGARVATNSRHH